MALKDWSETAGDNDDADASINWAEGQAPSTVNGSARAMMAVLRTALGHLVSVKDYGAVGDGTTDDTSAIQTCLTACAGQRIYFPEGDYLISDTLTVADNTELTGDAPSYSGASGSRITLAASSDVDMISNSDATSGNRYITIRDLFLNGNSSNQTSGNGIYFTKSRNCKVERVKFNMIKNSALKLSEGGEHVIVANACMNCEIGFQLAACPDNYLAGNDVTTSGDGVGISLATSSDHNIITGNFVFLSDIGYHISGSNNNIITNNRSNTNKRDGIFLNGADNCVVVGNHCYDNGTSGSGTRAGIEVGGTSEQNLIVGNRCKNVLETSQVYGIRLENTAFYNLIEGNQVTGNATAGIFFSGGSHANGNMVRNNYALATATPTFSTNDATPSVAQGEVFRTNNGLATTITALDDGTVGKRVTVVINDNLTTVDFTGTTMKGNGGVDWSPTAGDHMVCVYDGANWYCNISDNTP